MKNILTGRMRKVLFYRRMYQVVFVGRDLLFRRDE